MVTISPLNLLLTAGVALTTLVNANTVTMGGFHKMYGMTGCLKDPTQGCGRKGDICYNDRQLAFAITGTAPVCNACMPKDYRNIATYDFPANLPCAIWRYYQCDDAFVTFMWNKSGSNGCIFGGAKSYNMYDQYGTAAANENEFIKTCRQHKSLADYGLDASVTPLINEKDFCFPLRQNLTMTNPTQKNQETYEQYYDNKFGKQ